MASILSINGRSDIGLISARDYFKMSPAQFGSYIRSVHSTLVEELAAIGVDYGALGPALIPSTTRHEVALFFNSTVVDGGMYGYEIAERLIPLLGRDSTLAYLSGDILRPVAEVVALAEQTQFTPGRLQEWGNQWIYCVYINNLSTSQAQQLTENLSSFDAFLGHADMTYGSALKTLLGTMLPTSFIKNGSNVIVDHGLDDPFVSNLNEIGFPFSENELRVVSVQSSFGPLITYKIESLAQPYYTDDIEISLNAISELPLPLGDFEIVLSDGKYGYVQTKKRELLEIAGLHELSAADLAARIRAEVERSAIYRMQYNPDDTVQFTIYIEIARPDRHPVKLAVALKYQPVERALFVVTIT